MKLMKILKKLKDKEQKFCNMFKPKVMFWCFFGVLLVLWLVSTTK